MSHENYEVTRNLSRDKILINGEIQCYCNIKRDYCNPVLVACGMTLHTVLSVHSYYILKQSLLAHNCNSSCHGKKEVDGCKCHDTIHHYLLKIIISHKSG